MSWIFVEGVDQGALYDALDLVSTGSAPDYRDLGTNRVPLAGAGLKSGWCAVFAKYALVMDATMGTDPPRVTRLPAKSRCVTCVVLEHRMVSYSNLWESGRLIWQIRYGGSKRLDACGDLPPEFSAFRDIAVDKERVEGAGGEYIFDVPLDTAATITGYRHDRAIQNNFFMELQSLVPTRGNLLTKMGQPPAWWQTLGSIKYE